MVNAPLSRVAAAAEQVGLNIQSPPLDEQGPAQLRRVIRALNSMQGRLQRFLLDRQPNGLRVHITLPKTLIV
jgi:hypothetical protein